MEPNKTPEEALVPSSADTSPEAEPMAAWEEIEDGRFMPRRVRGSCHGRELG